MGYKSEQFVKKVDENLVCSICQEVFQNPVSCKAGHTFCRDCISEWLKKSKKCPLDNRFLNENDLGRNLIAKSMIDNLDVYCDPPAECVVRSVQSCGWTGKLQNLDKHRKTCPFQEEQCPHENCKKTMQRREIEEHDKVCKFKMVKCEACRKHLIRHEMEKHIKDDCPETLISCPKNCTYAQGDIKKIKRKSLNQHLTNVCAKAIVDCPFKEQGCAVRVERQNFDKHKNENMDAHMMLIAKQCSSLTQENQLLKIELNKVRIENTQLKEEINKVKESVSTYVWTIDDFNSLAMKYPNGSYFTSPTFWLCGNRWYLKIYPNGYDTESTEFLSLFLFCNLNKDDDSQTSNVIVANSKTCASFRLSVISQESGTKDVNFEKPAYVFSKTSNGLGYRKLIKTTNVLSTAYCNSTDGSLTIQCTIQLVRPQ